MSGNFNHLGIDMHILKSTNHKILDKTSKRFKEIAIELGAAIKGPIPLRTRKIVIPTRKSPDGEGSETWDHWSIAKRKRILYSDIHEKFLRRILKEKINDEVQMSIIFTKI